MRDYQGSFDLSHIAVARCIGLYQLSDKIICDRDVISTYCTGLEIGPEICSGSFVLCGRIDHFASGSLHQLYNPTHKLLITIYLCLFYLLHKAGNLTFIIFLGLL